MMLNTPGANDIHKATILARGRALGMVAALPAGNMNNVTKQQMLANMDVLMGGRVAEGMIFGEDQITTGASSDLLKAANIAKQMVTNYGFGERTQARYLDGHIKDLSSEARANMDLDQQDLIEASYKRAQALLLHKKDDLHILAQALLDKETLTGPEIDALLPRVELSI
jgi:ATP-dependent metalloprotease